MTSYRRPSVPPPLGVLRYPPGIKEEDYQRAAASSQLSSLPRVTVLTPSFNQGAFLETTIRSVLLQGYPNLEYIIIDGGSTDQSLNIIRHYSAHLSCWVSEKDQGQADAIAKGLACSTGHWFNWINSDDVLAPGALWRIVAAPVGTDVVAGATQEFLDDRCLRRFTNDRLAVGQMLVQERWHQPSIWLKGNAVAALGIDTQLHYKFDFLLLLRYLARHPRVQACSETLAYFRLHGTSKTMSQRRRFVSEKRLALSRLLEDPALAPWQEQIGMLERRQSWRTYLEEVASRMNESRWKRLREVWEAMRQERAIRCSATTRRAMIRLALRGGRRRRKLGRPQ